MSHDPLAKLHAHALDKRSAWQEPLSAVDLVPDQPGFILWIDGFLSPKECARLTHAANCAGLERSPEADRRPRKGEAYLDRETASFAHAAVSDEIWARLQPLLPKVDRPTGRAVALGLHSDGRGRGGAGREGESRVLKYYRYQRGHRFGPHVDQSWKGAAAGHETEYTMLIYLNSVGEPVGAGEPPLRGGHTLFHRTAKEVLCEVVPRAGCALLHAHGRRCLMHESTEVTKGAKYVLRADIMYRPASTE